MYFQAKPFNLGALLALHLGTTTAGEFDFNLPTQNLATALEQVSKQTGLHVFYADATVQGRQSNRLSGRYSQRQAVEKLLAGSGLDYAFTADNAVAVKPAAKPPSKTAESVAATLPTVVVTGQQANPATDPYNEDYVLPNATAGTKADTPIMETPLNVQVISQQVLTDQQVISIDQAIKNVSGIVNNPANTGGLSESYTLRGFQSQTIFRNGFRLEGFDTAFGSRQMANVQSVEVLKGPAAILYGRVDPGGIINVVTKQPLATPYYSLQQQFGSYDLYRTNLDVTGPLSTNGDVLYRVNFSYEDKGSFRDLIDSQRVFVAPVVTWNISPKTRANFEMEYYKDRSSFDNQTLPLINHQVYQLPRNSNLTGGNPQTGETFFGGFNLTHEFNDDWKLKHSIWINHQNKDLSPSSIALFTTDFTTPNLAQATIFPYQYAAIMVATYATDLNLIGHFDTGPLRHTLLIGGDYYRTDFSRTLANAAGGFPTVDINTLVHSASTLPDLTARTNYEQNTDNYGFYLQDQIKLPYNVHVLGGFRYQYIHQKMVTECGAATCPDGTNAGFGPTLTDDAVTPRVGILWQAQNWLSVYGNYVENFGPNANVTLKDNKPLPPRVRSNGKLAQKLNCLGGACVPRWLILI